MFHRIHFASAGLLCLLGLLSCLAAPAQTERILSYHSDITVQDDASMSVTETIQVLSNGIQIRHGIYRDFPTRYTDRLGNRYVVGFTFLGATRDGSPEEYRVEDLSNGKRIYLGSPSVMIPPGDHTYTLRYTTDRQLGFFKDHDELFWNVTGNGWIFPIIRASATVHLPDRVPLSEVQLGGFTGPQGSLEKSLTTGKDSEGAFHFVTLRSLGSHEGLTILLSFPKGFFAAPTRQQEFQYFLRDNREAALAGGGLLVLLLYYYLVWSAVGRDPARGVIMPLYEPPSGFSPAATRYLVHMGYDNKTFAAAILDMAVRGYLTIAEQAGSYTLYRTKADDRVLTPDEKEIASALFDGRNEIWLHNENHLTISSAIKHLRVWLKSAEQQTYFLTNGKYSIPAIVFSVVFLFGIVAMQGGPKIFIAAFLCVWLSIWSLAVAGLLAGTFQLWKAVLSGSSPGAGSLAKAIMGSVASVPFLAGECLGIFMLTKATSITISIILLLAVFIHILFHFLLKAPTRAGRAVLDRIEGFKMFLGAVDGDRLNHIMPPEKTPAVFEKFLPYALALGVEQKWAENFSGVLGAANNAPGSSSSPGYSPSWYSGPGWTTLGAAGFASSLGGSFSSAISSSAAAPGSSGGGGGGSGGGGGGGGGGGW
ncbi:MAG TPA: DUF2207 domain-containing protein [Terriglobales bacterium]|nr:DUF2207 domain-containing protein [Terriglobales bacterium]